MYGALFEQQKNNLGDNDDFGLDASLDLIAGFYLLLVSMILRSAMRLFVPSLIASVWWLLPWPGRSPPRPRHTSSSSRHLSCCDRCRNFVDVLVVGDRSGLTATLSAMCCRIPYAVRTHVILLHLIFAASGGGVLHVCLHVASRRIAVA